MSKVNLGDTARDRITGFAGICIARTEWISGCTRCTLQPAVGADGKIPQSETFDEPMLDVAEVGTFDTAKVDKDGGPRPDTPHHPPAVR